MAESRPEPGPDAGEGGSPGRRADVEDPPRSNVHMNVYIHTYVFCQYIEMNKHMNVCLRYIYIYICVMYVCTYMYM